MCFDRSHYYDEKTGIRSIKSNGKEREFEYNVKISEDDL